MQKFWAINDPMENPMIWAELIFISSKRRRRSSVKSSMEISTSLLDSPCPRRSVAVLFYSWLKNWMLMVPKNLMYQKGRG